MDTKSAERTEGAAAEVAAQEPARATPAPGSSIPPEELEQLTADIVAALKTVYDPEIPADIYELGLIYKIDVDDDRNIAVEMTLTAPGCPVAGEMPVWVENAVSSVPGVGPGQGDAHLRPALGPEPHVRRGPPGAQHVLMRHAVISGGVCEGESRRTVPAYSNAALSLSKGA